MLHSFWLGFRFDLRIVILLILPTLVLGGLRSLSWQHSTRAAKVWSTLYTTIYTIVIITYLGDFGYYAYLESRINFRIFEFAKDPLISLHMVLESYNVLLWGSLLILFSIGVYTFFINIMFQTLEAESAPRMTLTRARKTSTALALTAFILLGLHNSFGQYPLRWSEAFFTQNMFLAHLAMNPIHYIFDTAQNSKRDYDTDKVKKYYSVIAPYLGVKNLDEKNLNFRRDVDQAPQFPTHPNIVYIVMESMAAYKTGAFGNPAQSSPSLDHLAEKGWLFENYYVPTEGTARSLFCILSGVPDINAKSTSSRNPLIIDQNTLINGLKAEGKPYKKYYFIGGSAAWGNIRGVYMNNVEGLEMFEGDRLAGPRTDVWGLSDLDLFRQAAKTLTEKTSHKSPANASPFFALIQSASFHRPYTIPPEHGDFETKTLLTEELAKFGFNSNEEYNSFRFADYSLGEFFRLIANSDFYKNTIFIIQGDHGLPHDGAAHLTDGYKFFNINRFHTPLVFYSPLIQTPKRFKNIITEPDVWPTVLGLLGYNHTNTGLGRNVLALKPDDKHYSFSYVYYSDPLQILLYDHEYLAFGTEDGVQSLHQYMGEQSQKDVKAQFPEKFQEMNDLLMGLFETSKYLLHHNKKQANPNRK